MVAEAVVSAAAPVAQAVLAAARRAALAAAAAVAVAVRAAVTAAEPAFRGSPPAGPVCMRHLQLDPKENLLQRQFAKFQ